MEKYIKHVIAVILILVCIFPVTTFAYDAPAPDGSNTLLQLFPDPVVAEDISLQIGEGGDTSFIPDGESAFDGVTTVSLPNSEVNSLVGLQLCQNLENLILNGNDLKDSDLDVLADMPSLANLNLSGTGIGDAGAIKIAGHLTGLTILNLSDNEISDDGAEVLTGITDANVIDLNLNGNHISPVAVKGLIEANFASLSLDDQTITASGITTGRTDIVHNIFFNHALINANSISHDGVLNTGRDESEDELDGGDSTIIWSARMENEVFSYEYAYRGYSGKVYVPFTYEAFIYTVTFDDRIGGINQVKVEDTDAVAAPEDPVRSGYEFLGWYTDEEGRNLYDFLAKVTGDITLYAGWDQNVEDSGIVSKEHKASPKVDTGTDADSNADVNSNPSGHGSSPATGDDLSMFYPAMILIFIAAIGMLICIILRRKDSYRS
jgi:uncharacterized repeat protein (TIGR02543 family)